MASSSTPGIGTLYGRALLAALLAGSVGLVVARAAWTQSGYYLFMLWNLFLAVLPFGFAILLTRAAGRGAPDSLQVALLLLWLLFLPNAPYILTDFVHLTPDGSRLYWYDLGMLLACAATGLLFGYASLFEVHDLAERRFGPRAGWGVAVVALLASGYGVYLGRVQRWNSWDVVTSPQGLATAIVDMVLEPAQHLHAWVMSGLFGIGLVAGYAVLHVVRRTGPALTAGS
jgi:uncharacterized membrane protein